MRAPPSGRQRLTSFRLTDIPLDRRLRAARALAGRPSAIADDDVAASERLLARLRSDFWDAEQETDTASYAGLRKVAERPPDRVYWIPADAYERVLGEERR